MKSSVRNVATGLLVSGAVFLFLGLLYSTVSLCAVEGGSCMAAAVTFGVVPEGATLSYSSDLSLSGSTVTMVPESDFLSRFFTTVKILGVDLLFIAVGILIVLELMELYYLRALLPKQLLRKRRVVARAR